MSTFMSAEHFVERLSEVEKAEIRGASAGKLDWLFYNIHRFEFNLEVAEAYRLFCKSVEIVIEKFKEGSQEIGFGKTWRF